MHILPTSSSKSTANRSISFNILKCKASSGHSPAHFLSTTFLDRSAKRGNKDPIGDPSLPERTKRFAPYSVLTREFTRFRTVAFPNYLMMDGWHDAVVDRMMGMLIMTIVRNSEVFQLNFLWSHFIIHGPWSSLATLNNQMICVFLTVYVLCKCYSYLYWQCLTYIKYVCIYIYVYMYKYIYICIYICIYMYIYTCIYIYMYIYIYMQIYIYMIIYVYIVYTSVCCIDMCTLHILHVCHVCTVY